MAMTLNEARETRRKHRLAAESEAWERAEQRIDTILGRYDWSRNVPLTIDVPSLRVDLDSQQWERLAEKIGETYRRAGWRVTVCPRLIEFKSNESLL
jgi:hypothetical protein